MTSRFKDLLAAGLLAAVALGYSFWVRDQLRPEPSAVEQQTHASPPHQMITRSRVPGVGDAPDAHLDDVPSE